MASTAPQDNGGSLRKSIGLIELFTFWTCEPIRPAQAFQIGSAGGIIGKNPLKIGKRCWKAAGVHSGKLSPIHRIGNKPDRQERTLPGLSQACSGSKQRGIRPVGAGDGGAPKRGIAEVCGSPNPIEVAEWLPSNLLIGMTLDVLRKVMKRLRRPARGNVVWFGGRLGASSMRS